MADLAEKVYAEAPPEGPIRAATKALHPHEAQAIRVQALAAAIKTPYVFDAVGHRITIKALSYDDNNRLLIVARAVNLKTGEPLPLSDLYRFTNPIITIPAGTWKRGVVTEKGTIDVEHCIEDLPGSIRWMITDQVRARIKGL